MKKQRLRTLKDRITKELKNKKFKKYYDEEGVNVNIALEIVKFRSKNQLTQDEFAKKLHIPQQVVSRLEQPDYTGYTLKTLLKLTKAFNKKLIIKFQ